MNTSIETLSRILISIALLMQLFTLRSSNRINSNAFFVWALGSYMRTYDYYMKDNKKITQRVSIKLFNSSLVLLIAILSR